MMYLGLLVIASSLIFEMATGTDEGIDSGDSDSSNVSDEDSDEHNFVPPWVRREEDEAAKELVLNRTVNVLDVTVSSVKTAAVKRLKGKGFPYIYSPVGDIAVGGMKIFIGRVKALTGYSLPEHQPVLQSIFEMAYLVHLLYFEGKPTQAFTNKLYSRPMKRYLFELPSISALNLWPAIVVAWFEECMTLTTGNVPKHGTGSLALACNAQPAS